MSGKVENASANQEQLEAMIRIHARDEVVALLDIIIRIFESGELKDPLEILQGARNAVIKRGMQPLINQAEKNLGLGHQGQ